MSIHNLDLLGLPQGVEGVCAHTDFGWFEHFGIPTIVIGAGDPRKAHQNDESISEDDLIKFTKFIALTILNWTSSSNKGEE
jgi:acetylornithine deacetylase